jgi:peptidoglycan/xylan/chitin deacetylase (PgdA/CDA1 family)
MFRKWQDISDAPKWQLRDELTETERKGNWEIGEFRNWAISNLPINKAEARSVFNHSIAQCLNRSIAQSLNRSIPQCPFRYNRSMLGALVAGAATAAAVAAGYQSMAPTGQWYGRTFIGLAPRTKKLALTYDDGPNDPHTLRLLEVLARRDVLATFFLIGRYARQRTDIAREILKAGHVIGNHTFTHPNLIFKTESETRKELTDCRAALQDAIGPHSALFRPPFGGRRPATLRVARELGLQPVMWNVTGYDWNAPPAAVIEKKVSRQIRGGDVILLHDGSHKQMGADRSQTVTATDHLITRYKSEGYEFVTIPEMMAKTVGHQPAPVTTEY